jgi:tripartite-type tricarboxylate transporter receptor subunit TctC
MRRGILKTGALALAGLVAGGRIGPAAAQEGWPTRPIRLIVPYIPGSAPDVTARHLVERMGAALGQPVVIENRGGAGGNIGNEAAARSAPDGYTLLLGTNAMLVLPQLHRRSVGYDPLRDFVPIVNVASMPHLLIAPSDGPRSVPELIDTLRRQPGLPYASGGNGSGAHLAAELFKAMAGVDAMHIPFRGAPDIVNNVMSGQVRFGFPTLGTATELVRSGRLRGLGVTSPERNPALPEVSTIAETVPGFDLVSWFAILGPAAMPDHIVRRVDEAVRTALTDPLLRARIEVDGTVVLGMPAARFAEFYQAEYRKWGEAVRISKAVVD